MWFSRLCLIGVMASCSAVVSAAQTCQSTPERHAAKIMGTPYVAGHSPRDFVEAFGQTPFLGEAGGRYVFAILPNGNDWAVRVFAAPFTEGAIDLSQITPDRGGVNARDIRAADLATLASEGKRAPDRLFFFSDSLAGTGGYKPPRGSAYMPTPQDGMGWLKIRDYGLSDLDGARAPRLTYLKIEACLTWPKTDAEIRTEADAASPDYTQAETDGFKTCGLDMDQYELNARMLPRLLRGSVYGAGRQSTTAQIRRKRDGKRGIAMCTDGTQLDVMGMNPGQISGDLMPRYFDQIGMWSVLPKGATDHNGVPVILPNGLEGDMLALERYEKELIVLFRKGGRWQSKRIYHFD